ncbi:MAG TPA: nucleoside phosphorylase [Clostridiaceae bacterium]|nr:nucleoside phosphorylase [Clostridiaceae bacterium]
MVLFVVALMVEAAPIIDYFNLKKDMNVRAFTVYKNTDMALIVSGVGKLKSSAATAYICSHCGTTEKDILINIGFCGAYGSNYAAGTLLLVNKITDADSNKDYYPDVLYSQNIPRVNLWCYSKVVREKYISKSNQEYIRKSNFDEVTINERNNDEVNNSEGNNEKPFFCDMESAGFMEAASRFVYAHNIVVLKIISDHLEPDDLDKKLLKSFVSKRMTQVESIIHELKELNSSIDVFSFSEEEKEVFDVIFVNFRFSEAMKQKFLKVMKILKLKGIEPVHFLQSYIKIKASSKLEGKKLLEDIFKRSKEGNV